MEAMRTLRIFGRLERRIFSLSVHLRDWLAHDRASGVPFRMAELLCLVRLDVFVLGFQVRIALGERHYSTHE